MDPEQEVDGTLEATPLPSLLAHLATTERTGVLRIAGDAPDRRSEVWLSRGRTYLVIAGSSPPLSHVLCGAGLGPVGGISEALAASVEHARNGKKAPIDELIDDHPGAIETVRRVLHEHNLSSLFEMLVPSDAGYRFEPGARHPLGDRFATDTADLVAEAERRVEIWRRIAARIPSTSAVFALAPSLPEGSTERVVTADEWRFLARLNGRNTVADIISQTGESAFRVCSALYRLLLEQVVTDVKTGADRSA